MPCCWKMPAPPLLSITSCQHWLPLASHRAARGILPDPRAWGQAAVVPDGSRALRPGLLARETGKAAPFQHG